MKVALTTVVDGVPEGLDAFLGFHRSAGVDVVVMGESTTSAALADAVSGYEREGFVRRVSSACMSGLALVAVDDLGADWLIPSALDELWWPRGESLKDVLAVIPPRYGVVQGLVRTFVGVGEPSGPVAPSVFSARDRTHLTPRSRRFGRRAAQRAPPARLSRGAENDA